MADAESQKVVSDILPEAAPGTRLDVGDVIHRSSGQDITRKPSRKQRIMVVLPTQLSFLQGSTDGQLGRLEGPNTENPLLVLPVAGGSLRFSGRKITSTTSFYSVAFKGKGGSAACEDVFNNILVFRDPVFKAGNDIGFDHPGAADGAEVTRSPSASQTTTASGEDNNMLFTSSQLSQLSQVSHDSQAGHDPPSSSRRPKGARVWTRRTGLSALADPVSAATLIAQDPRKTVARDLAEEAARSTPEEASLSDSEDEGDDYAGDSSSDGEEGEWLEQKSGRGGKGNKRKTGVSAADEEGLEPSPTRSNPRRASASRMSLAIDLLNSGSDDEMSVDDNDDGDDDDDDGDDDDEGYEGGGGKAKVKTKAHSKVKTTAPTKAKKATPKPKAKPNAKAAKKKKKKKADEWISDEESEEEEVFKEESEEEEGEEEEEEDGEEEVNVGSRSQSSPKKKRKADEAVVDLSFDDGEGTASPKPKTKPEVKTKTPPRKKSALVTKGKKAKKSSDDDDDDHDDWGVDGFDLFDSDASPSPKKATKTKKSTLKPTGQAKSKKRVVDESGGETSPYPRAPRAKRASASKKAIVLTPDSDDDMDEEEASEFGSDYD